MSRAAGVLLLLHLTAAAPAPAAAEGKATGSMQQIDLDGTVLDYALLLPEGYDPEATYPVLLALPPGGQDTGMVAWGSRRFWSHLAEQGWVVVSPAAPGGVLFFQGSERLLPGLLDAVAASMHVEGGKFHVAGVSNGGKSAFRFALEHPGRVASLVVAPGIPEGGDWDRLGALRDIPVALFAGAQDGRWTSGSLKAEKKLRELGVDVSLKVFAGEGHAIPSLDGVELARVLESFRADAAARGAGDADPP